MGENQFDTKIMKKLISIYEDINKEIDEFGEDIIRKHSPGLIARKKTIEEYIINYVQQYYPGLAYAEYMDVSEIEDYIIGK